MIWMHGRTVNKELDPGRYLRWMRAGIATCSVDLPGHGERFDAALQDAERTLDVIQQMLAEIDRLVEALTSAGDVDASRAGIGGASAGGMVALARLCREHPFRCASVEATSGSWRHQRHRAMFADGRDREASALDPALNLAGWREIPIQLIHARQDEWMSIEGQRAFVGALRSRYRHSDWIEFIEYDRTGAPFEHVGFGRMASDAKDRQVAFLRRWLVEEPSAD